MTEFKSGVGVTVPIFLLNLLLVKMSEKSLTKADFRSKKQKDMSGDGTMELLREGSTFYPITLVVSNYLGDVPVKDA